LPIGVLIGNCLFDLAACCDVNGKPATLNETGIYAVKSPALNESGISIQVPAVNCCSDQFELTTGSKVSNVTIDSYPQSLNCAELNKQIAAPDLTDSSSGIIANHYKSHDDSVITVNSSVQTEVDDANDSLSTR
jgi:hypothetical protein